MLIQPARRDANSPLRTPVQPGENPRRHLIISGTGRCGTTFLVQLLTQLGLDTGYPHPHARIHPNCNGGMEWDIWKDDAPYVVKRPALCEYLDQVLETMNIKIDHAIVPVRDLFSAAESRRDVTRRSPKKFRRRGGLWHTKNPGRQEGILTEQLYNLIHTLAKHDIPTTLLHFPRLARDPEYLYGKIAPLLPGIDYAAFLAGFQAVNRPELIHDFAGRKQAGEPSTNQPWWHWVRDLIRRRNSAESSMSRIDAR